VPLKDFRKLCILKGIYPRDPRKKVKGKDKTYYLTKDIVWLSHEPVLDTLRAIKAHKKKLSKAIARKDKRKAMDIEERMPEIRLDHLVKERYPSFGDALEDLHDCLTLVFAFATLPVMSKVKQQTVDLCESLCREWKWYVCATKSLQQTFLSVRAIYYTAIVDGHTITWSEPYRFSSSGRTKDVDFRVMATFVDFYTTSLRFILFRLFQAKGWNYPLPGVSNDAIEKDSLRGLPHCTYFVQSDANAQGESTGKTKKDSATQQKLNDYLKTVADTSKDSEDASNEAGDSGDEKENQKKEKFLFDGLVFFLSPEVPAYSVDFLIYGCGGRIAEDSKSSVVTHYVTDRPSHPSVQIPANVERIQPQWLYDSLNTHVLLPTHEYSPEYVTA
jgi:pescadillo